MDTAFGNRAATYLTLLSLTSHRLLLDMYVLKTLISVIEYKISTKIQNDFALTNSDSLDLSTDSHWPIFMLISLNHHIDYKVAAVLAYVYHEVKSN